MHWIDWLIVLIPFGLVLWLAVYACRYARGVVDFLAAGRVAGRYVISVGDVTTSLSVITLLAGAEQYYQQGFAIGYWNFLCLPVWILLSLGGFCTYRWRETRCLSRGEFIELRYGSKAFRFFTALVATISEMITNAIGPAIAANFFIYFLGLPQRVTLLGFSVPCYALLTALCLVFALVCVLPAGRISLLITDCIQGLFCYPIFLMITVYILVKFSWGQDMSPVLWDRVPGQSFVNPYDVSEFRDFNIFAIVVMLLNGILNRASWFGNDSTNSGRTAHEQKMAGVLGTWRSGFAFLMILVVSMFTICFMGSGVFARSNRFGITNNEIRRELAGEVLDEMRQSPFRKSRLDAKMAERVEEKLRQMPDVTHVIGVDEPLSQQNSMDTPYFDTVRNTLGNTPEGNYHYQRFRTIFQQMMFPVVLRKMLPVGLFGLFCLLMLMLLVSTDDTRLFNAAGAIMQDIILPFIRKGGISPRAHKRMLRLITVAVAVFFFVVGVFFQQLDYLNMFINVMSAIWLGGAGPIMLYGLYTRFGNLWGAWSALILGSGTSILGLFCQRSWALKIYPALDRMGWVQGLDHFLRAVSAPFHPWIHWEMSPEKFPVNSYEILFLSMLLANLGYILVSYMTYRPYNLDKLLHRGIYGDDGAPPKPQKNTARSWLTKILGITPEYTRGDRAIAWSVFFYSIVYQFLLCFVLNFLLMSFWKMRYGHGLPRVWWDTYFYITTLLVPVIIATVSTVWFSWGGIRDMRQLFRDLARRKDNPEENGQVS